MLMKRRWSYLYRTATRGLLGSFARSGKDDVCENEGKNADRKRCQPMPVRYVRSEYRGLDDRREEQKRVCNQFQEWPKGTERQDKNVAQDEHGVEERGESREREHTSVTFYRELADSYFRETASPAEA